MDEYSFRKQVETELLLEENEIDVPEELRPHISKELDYLTANPDGLDVIRKAYSEFNELGMENSSEDRWDTTILSHYDNYYKEFQQKEIHNTVDKLGRRVKPGKEGAVNSTVEGSLLKSLQEMGLASNRTNNTTARMDYEKEDYAAVLRVFRHLENEWDEA
ncbi:MAG: hypothetical protein H8Z69_05760 [Nanohaloarchaea archaeon]|nr:hypothetical protein [Candidatus Nanohaloarchaea archaeon]